MTADEKERFELLGKRGMEALTRCRELANRQADSTRAWYRANAIAQRCIELRSEMLERWIVGR